MEKKQGTIDISRRNYPPEKHELETAKYFAEKGKDIIFLPTRNMPKVRTPDILMDGLEWEIKSPKGKSSRTIEQNFRSAVQQSRYIIFDLRRLKQPEEPCIKKLKKEFASKGYVKRLLVIKKNRELIEFTNEKLTI